MYTAIVCFSYDTVSLFTRIHSFLHLILIISDTGVRAEHFQFKETWRICNPKQLYNSGDKRHSKQVSLLQFNYAPIATETNTLLNIWSSQILVWSWITINGKDYYRRRRVLTLQHFSEGSEETHGISYSGWRVYRLWFEQRASLTDAWNVTPWDNLLGIMAQYNVLILYDNYGFSRPSVMPMRVWAVGRVGYASDPTAGNKQYLPGKRQWPDIKC